jgi:TolA-binding protein
MSSDSAKKRQTVDDGGAELSMGREGEDSLPRQMMSAMKQLLDQNRRMESKIDRMQEEMKGELKVIVSRLDDVESRQKYHEMLLKNQRWEYPLTIPTSTSTGEQTRFLVDIKTQTCNMRYSKCNGVVEIGGGDLTYETTFFPHWKEFANSLELYQYALRYAPEDNYSTLHFYNIHLPEEVLGLLSTFQEIQIGSEQLLWA